MSSDSEFQIADAHYSKRRQNAVKATVKLTVILYSSQAEVHGIES